MSRKVFVEVKLSVVIDMEEGLSVDDVLSELTLTTECEGAEISDHSVLDHDVTDSN